MKKIPLEIAAVIQNEAQPNSFVVILKDAQSGRRLPIVIGPYEAQAIALVIENMKPTRPMTHDLFHTTLAELGIKLEEIIISDLKDNIFYAILNCRTAAGDVYDIDSRTSDALALALRAECPIFVYDFVLENAGLDWRDIPSPVEEPTPEFVDSNDLSLLNMGQLQQHLDAALEAEDYEQAAKIRDELRRRETGS